jgi:hypothetical protein
MNLCHALLCVDCEWIYAETASCPRCGSRVAFPVARAMNHSLAPVARFAAPRPLPALATERRLRVGAR